MTHYTTRSSHYTTQFARSTPTPMLFHLLRAFRTPTSTWTRSSSSTSTRPTQRIQLTASQIDTFHTDGYLHVKSFFPPEECQLLLDTIEQDPSINEQVMPMQDAAGRSSKLTLWFHLGKDTYSAFGRSRSLVSAAQALIGGVEPYFFHTKIMLKEPRIGGQWEWHQDFGYWYAQGLLQPVR